MVNRFTIRVCSQVLAVMVLTSIVAIGAEVQPDVLCGPRCLLEVCKRLGVNTTLREIARLSDYEPDKGCTLQGLYGAARAKGLEVVGAKVSLDELASIGVPAIAHLWTNHFVILEPTTDSRFIVTDLSRKSHQSNLVSKTELAGSYSGFALLVTKDKISLPASAGNGPDLRVDCYVYDFGPIDEGERVSHEFKLKNLGNQELVISQVRSTCDCTVTSFSNEKIPPQGVRQLRVTFDSAGRRGATIQRIYISTNDPATPVVPLTAKSLVRPVQLLVLPKSLYFGPVKRGMVATRAVRIANPLDANFEVKEASSRSSLITTSIKSAVNPDKSEYCRAEAKDYLVAVTLRPDCRSGSFKSKVTIHTNCAKQPTVVIPVTATILDDVVVCPDMFFLGMLKKGEGAAKSITISTTGKDSFIIDKVDSPFDFIAVEVTPKVEGKEYTVTATLKETAPVGNIKGDVVIHTSNPDQPEIKVPLYALVEDK